MNADQKEQDGQDRQDGLEVKNAAGLLEASVGSHHGDTEARREAALLRDFPRSWDRRKGVSPSAHLRLLTKQGEALYDTPEMDDQVHSIRSRSGWSGCAARKRITGIVWRCCVCGRDSL
jgi:hypothetical protein